MIRKVFTHCQGIGPVSQDKLRKAGYNNWDQCLKKPGDIPLGEKKVSALLTCLERSQQAFTDDDIDYFTRSFPCREHWRLLYRYFSEATFFDIETTGLSRYDSEITVISAFFKGRLYTFFAEENLDDFLDLIEDSKLLVAFNGNSFDIPFVENYFNLPDIGCPFIDLRWITYHAGYSGGLKWIEKDLDLTRPPGFEEVDGFEAVTLYENWLDGDITAKEKLIRYCRLDVLMSFLVAERVLENYISDYPLTDHDLLIKQQMKIDY